MRAVNFLAEQLMTDIRKKHPGLDAALAQLPPRNKKAIKEYQAAALYALVCKHQPTRILEIGTSHGYSTRMMELAAPVGAKIISLNPQEHEAELAQSRLERTTVLAKASWDYLREYEGEPFDFIFVDGDHKRVRLDFPWWQYLTEGGVMVFHDYSPEDAAHPCPPVYEAINEFCDYLGKEKPDILIVDREKTGMAGFVKGAPDTLSASAIKNIEDCLTHSSNSETYLQELYGLARGLRRNAGALVECGVRNGGSLVVAALGAKRKGRAVHAFDSFKGMPRPTGIDGEEMLDSWTDGERQAGILQRVKWLWDLFPQLQTQLTFGIGLFAETMPSNTVGKIAMLHVDAALYESTMLALEHMVPRVTHGGVIAVAEYHKLPGVRAAVDAYLGSPHARILMPLGDDGVYWRVLSS